MHNGSGNPVLTVVVVDSDPAVRHSLKFSLELEGFVVATYANAQDLLEGDIPDQSCLVIDYNLPGMNGWDLLAELRSRDISIPAILVATQPSAVLRHRAVDAGYRIVEKPLLGDALVRCIQEIFVTETR
jgi:FixJ family two-component response regulator